jgi:hypothetical protein
VRRGFCHPTNAKENAGKIFFIGCSAALSMTMAAKADTITVVQNEIEYSNVINDDYGARFCKIVLVAFSFAAPKHSISQST